MCIHNLQHRGPHYVYNEVLCAAISSHVLVTAININDGDVSFIFIG